MIIFSLDVLLSQFWAIPFFPLLVLTVASWLTYRLSAVISVIILKCMCISFSVLFNSFNPRNCLLGFFCSWDFPDKNTEVGGHWYSFRSLQSGDISNSFFLVSPPLACGFFSTVPSRNVVCHQNIYVSYQLHCNQIFNHVI